MRIISAYLQMTFRYIGGKCRVLRAPTLVQCESSFAPNFGSVCITSHAYFKEGEKKRLTWLPAKNRREGEFMAVYESILFCIDHSVDSIHVENDSEYVFRTLTTPARRFMYQSHRNAILALATGTEWTALRYVKKPLDEDYDTFKAFDHLLGQ